MKRALPLWLAALVPATLVGHGLAYAITGRSIADTHHAWLAPVMECSLAALFAICTLLLGSTLIRAGVLVHTNVERSWVALWPRLAVLQLALFMAMERAEGTHAGVVGCLVQLLVAFAVAYTLALFARILLHCSKAVEAASRYLERALHPIVSFVSRRPSPVAYALAVHAGASRFQRPPPSASASFF